MDGDTYMVSGNQMVWLLLRTKIGEWGAWDHQCVLPHKAILAVVPATFTKRVCAIVLLFKGLELPNDMLMELMSYEARGRLFRCRTGTGNVSGTGSSRRHHWYGLGTVRELSCWIRLVFTWLNACVIVF